MTHPRRTSEVIRTSKTSVTVQLEYESRGLVLANYGHVCVAIWTSKPTPALFEKQRATLAACTQRYPGQAMFLCIVSGSADPPEPAERAATVRMIREQEKLLVGCACVIEGDGFRAALTRSVLTGMTLLSRTAVPTAFFEDVSRAVAWMRLRSDHPLGGLTDQLRTLRQVHV